MAKAKHEISYGYSTLYTVEIDGEGDDLIVREFEVDANVEEYIPARMGGHPDDREPASGGGVEEWRIKYEGKVLTDAEFVALGGNIKYLEEQVKELAYQNRGFASYYGDY